MELELVFNMFEQSSKHKSQVGGKHIGLSICKETVKLHRGKIQVESPVKVTG
jgi:signal transduction histidine kinase